MKENVIAIFDTGKTNKKLLLFNEAYEIVYEKGRRFREVTDDDGFPCEHLGKLQKWVISTIHSLISSNIYNLVAINFASYGASLVHFDHQNQQTGYLYNYLKPLPQELVKKFNDRHNTINGLEIESQSPILGMLNSGLQLYWLKYFKPGIFDQVKTTIHFTHYFSHLLTKGFYNSHTALGCHTLLWNYEVGNYHDWVRSENLEQLFPPINPTTQYEYTTIQNKKLLVGIGIHDSSAAIIPFMKLERNFLLISSGTWCISMNPYNHSGLDKKLLKKDVLTYTSHTGNRILASRAFLGKEHDLVESHIAGHFGKSGNYCKTVKYNPVIINDLLLNKTGGCQHFYPQHMHRSGPFTNMAELPLPDLGYFKSYEEAYHQLMLDLVYMQKVSTDLVINKTINKIIVTGGFTVNNLYMNLLAEFYPQYDVYSSEVRRATAFGAAMLLHEKWNRIILPDNLLKYNKFTASGIHDLSKYDPFEKVK